MADATEENVMQLPRAQRGPLVYNLNTYIMVAGFLIMLAGGLIAWGYAVSEFRGSLEDHDEKIERLDNRLTVTETALRITDNHEFRITNIERQLADAASTARETIASVNSLKTDVQVIREIVQRMEASQSRSRSPPRD